MATNSRSHTDVIVAGAGPVGLTLAAELRLAGIDVLVVERALEPSRHSRAFGLLPRTMEVWEQRGVADRFTGLRLPHADLAADMVDLDFTRLDTRHGQMLLAQATTERVLAQWADELGVKLVRGHEVVGVEQDAGTVTVDVLTAGERRRIHADYLVGCDGARSAVRTCAGIDFPGEYTRAEFVLVDLVEVDRSDPRFGRLPLFERGPNGLLVILPISADTVRVVAHEYGAPYRGGRGTPTWEEAKQVFVRAAGFDLAAGRPVWISRFGNTARQATAYRLGRILLAGDAAHTLLPAGGQGLNLGVQDAVNLGWKLAAELGGWAPPGLLDTYHSERHPVAGQVLRNAKAQFALMLGGPEIDALRELLGELLAFEHVNRFLAGQVGGTAIRYDVGEGDHPLTGCRLPYRPLTVEGERTDTMRLLHRARGVLLALAPGPWAVADDWTDRIDIVRAHALDTDAGYACALIRPDGHVAWAATAEKPDASGLDAALRRWFGAPRGERTTDRMSERPVEL
ncbi:FAD-dependent monooxygenase [Nonomuraea sp. NEAU-A123]|uniref:FAD-dependent monooxygenase n=1 Tax=Nonomuraea sp. NEAU-A123 TaxID=2839649 RepID=UPI001BE47540|nr:FAD-dependent monooxygenase [Nonomuraea sp. NEAU-A123]MBT2224818.1 FAD-dependent monooxygenase [Nonomuraea sp. NEAU-A123]